VASFALQPRALLLRAQYRSYASCATAALLAGACWPLGEALGALALVLPTLACLALGHALRGLLLSQADGVCTPPEERRASLFAGLAGVVLAALALAAPGDPHGLRAAAPQLAPLLARLRSAGSLAEAQARWSAGGAAYGVLCVPLVLTAGALAGLLAAPGARWARSYSLSTSPPRFCARLVGASLLTALLLRTAFCCTAFAALLPHLQTGAARSAVAGPLLLLVAACSHAATLRAHTQSYLDAALVSWYELRHSAGVSADMALRVMLQKFDAQSRLVCKAALQHAAPPAIMLAAALLMLARRESLDQQHSAQAALPAAVLRSAAYFLGTWACACWTAAAGSMLAALQVGLLKA